MAATSAPRPPPHCVVGLILQGQKVKQIVPGSPAYYTRAFRKEDMITSIDGILIEGIPKEAVDNLLRGSDSPGSKLTVCVKRLPDEVHMLREVAATVGRRARVYEAIADKPKVLAWLEEDFFAAERDQRLLSEAFAATASSANQAYEDYCQQTRRLEQVKEKSTKRLVELEKAVAESVAIIKATAAKAAHFEKRLASQLSLTEKMSKGHEQAMRNRDAETEKKLAAQMAAFDKYRDELERRLAAQAAQAEKAKHDHEQAMRNRDAASDKKLAAQKAAFEKSMEEYEKRVGEQLELVEQGKHDHEEAMKKRDTDDEKKVAAQQAAFDKSKEVFEKRLAAQVELMAKVKEEHHQAVMDKDKDGEKRLAAQKSAFDKSKEEYENRLAAHLVLMEKIQKEHRQALLDLEADAKKRLAAQQTAFDQVRAEHEKGLAATKEEYAKKLAAGVEEHEKTLAATNQGYEKRLEAQVELMEKVTYEHHKELVNKDADAGKTLAAQRAEFDKCKGVYEQRLVAQLDLMEEVKNASRRALQEKDARAEEMLAAGKADLNQAQEECEKKLQAGAELVERAQREHQQALLDKDADADRRVATQEAIFVANRAVFDRSLDEMRKTIEGVKGELSEERERCADLQHEVSELGHKLADANVAIERKSCECSELERALSKTQDTLEEKGNKIVSLEKEVGAASPPPFPHDIALLLPRASEAATLFSP